jgi:hypothetical protein
MGNVVKARRCILPGWNRGRGRVCCQTLLAEFGLPFPNRWEPVAVVLKKLLIAARQANDLEAAKRLSFARVYLRRNLPHTCLTCGEAIRPKSQRCQTCHRPRFCLPRRAQLATAAACLLIFAGCQVPQPTPPMPPLPPGAARTIARTNVAALVTARTEARATLPPAQRTFRASWQLWSEGIHESTNRFPCIRILLDWRPGLAGAWSNVANLPPNATNCTFTVPASDVNLFRIGYTF